MFKTLLIINITVIFSDCLELVFSLCVEISDIQIHKNNIHSYKYSFKNIRTCQFKSVTIKA